MQLIVSLTSPYARKIRAIVAEKQLPCELVVDAPWEPGTRVPEFNPLGKVPVLVDDQGRSWFDSPVIADYLELLAPAPALLPADPLAALRVRQREALADGVLDAAVAIVIEYRRPADKQEPTVVARQQQKVERGLDALEAELDGRGLFGGEAPDLSDIAVGCMLGFLDFRLPDYAWRSARPALQALAVRLAARASFADTLPSA